MEYFLDALRKYANFEGRASRKSFWMYWLIYVIASYAIGFIDVLIGSGGIIAGLVWLALLLPSISLNVRRLHDINRSGWWLLLPIIPIIGVIVLLLFYVSKSVNEGNRFGPSDDSNGRRPTNNPSQPNEDY
jgi:uncharacterized membrane protein YhaH (DUF805 family)